MNIVIIGSGNVATHLSLALQKAGETIVQVYGRNKATAAHLAALLKVTYTTHFQKIHDHADLYIYAVSDSALSDLLQYPLATNALHVHTAGSVSLEVFKNKKIKYGVLYPLQTFSAHRKVNFKQIPLCVEANDAESELILATLAARLSEKVCVLDSDQRMKMHLAAVFSCNFVNYCYSIAEQLVKENDLSFDVLLPLITETAAKLDQLSPHQAQTGPARRNDSMVMEKHQQLLQHHPSWQQLYAELSRLIVEKYLHKP